jgi:hypothetical protein
MATLERQWSTTGVVAQESLRRGMASERRYVDQVPWAALGRHHLLPGFALSCRYTIKLQQVGTAVGFGCEMAVAATSGPSRAAAWRSDAPRSIVDTVRHSCREAARRRLCAYFAGVGPGFECAVCVSCAPEIQVVRDFIHAMHGERVLSGTLREVLSCGTPG